MNMENHTSEQLKTRKGKKVKCVEKLKKTKLEKHLGSLIIHISTHLLKQKLKLKIKNLLRDIT